ncbi:MAG: MFS transporter [Anaerolineaceae bacterium]|jgi:MFS family permease
MENLPEEKKSNPKLRDLPRNVWAVSATSFFMDVSSEMVINILPLFLANDLGIPTSVIGVIEGIAQSTASIVNIFSGWLSDKLHGRKWIAVSGYALSMLSKPFFYIANTWELVAGVRWIDRVGKGIRTAPRDALVAESVDVEKRGLAFGFSRAADTAGAMVGLLIALGAVWLAQQNSMLLSANTFRTIVLISIVPAVLAVLSLALGAKDVPVKGERTAPKFAFKSLGKNFMIFMFIVGLFELGNSSDAFLVLRAQDRGMDVVGILAMLASFNLIYALLSTPAGKLSDKIGRRKLIIGGWLMYAVVYLGFAVAQTGWHIFVFYILYGVYYGLAYGTTKAMIADLVPDQQLRGTAYGTYSAAIGIIDFPASLIAGLLWQGAGSWSGFGAAAPFLFGGSIALISTLLMAFVMPKTPATSASA